MLAVRMRLAYTRRILVTGVLIDAIMSGVVWSPCMPAAGHRAGEVGQIGDLAVRYAEISKA